MGTDQRTEDGPAFAKASAGKGQRLNAKDVLKAIVAGFRDPVTARDDLSFRFTQAPKVFCVRCSAALWYLKSRGEGYDFEFAPLKKGYPVRSDLVCPACGSWLCAFEGGAPKFKTDRGWR